MIFHHFCKSFPCMYTLFTLYTFSASFIKTSVNSSLTMKGIKMMVSPNWNDFGINMEHLVTWTFQRYWLRLIDFYPKNLACAELPLRFFQRKPVLTIFDCCNKVFRWWILKFLTVWNLRIHHLKIFFISKSFLSCIQNAKFEKDQNFAVDSKRAPVSHILTFSGNRKTFANFFCDGTLEIQV